MAKGAYQMMCPQEYPLSLDSYFTLFTNGMLGNNFAKYSKNVLFLISISFWGCRKIGSDKNSA